jgi:hypothetical protein
MKKKESFRQEKFLSSDSSGGEEEDEPKNTRVSRPRKQISWRYSRTPSPMPSGSRRSRTPSPVPVAARKSRTPSPVPRMHSEPIKLPSSQSQAVQQALQSLTINTQQPPASNGSGSLFSSPPSPMEAHPPLPYNIKSKKRNARRIQSIHHMVSEPLTSSSSLPSSDQEQSEREPTSPKNNSNKRLEDKLNSMETTVEGTTSDSGNSSTNQRRQEVLRQQMIQSDLDEVSSQFTTATKNNNKPLLVPCRLNDSSLVDLSMLPKPFTAKDQLRLATLLSTQESKFGFNMFDSLIPGDNEEIARLMSMGIRYEDSVLIIFEKRYVTKPHEQLASTAVPLSEYKPHALASVPTSAAVQLGVDLARSMSPVNSRANSRAPSRSTSPRPQSMPMTSHTRDFFNQMMDQQSMMGGPSNSDYGLNEHQYPGYTTIRAPVSVGNSRSHSPHPIMGNSRSHSPHPNNGGDMTTNSAPTMLVPVRQQYSSSAGVSRTHSPHPSDGGLYHRTASMPGSVGASRTHTPMLTGTAYQSSPAMLQQSNNNGMHSNSRSHSPHNNNNNNGMRPGSSRNSYSPHPVQAQAQYVPNNQQQYQQQQQHYQQQQQPQVGAYVSSAVSSKSPSRSHTPMGHNNNTNNNNNNSNNITINPNYYDPMPVRSPSSTNIYANNGVRSPSSSNIYGSGGPMSSGRSPSSKNNGYGEQQQQQGQQQMQPPSLLAPVPRNPARGGTDYSIPFSPQESVSSNKESPQVNSLFRFVCFFFFCLTFFSFFVVVETIPNGQKHHTEIRCWYCDVFTWKINSSKRYASLKKLKLL